MNKNLDGPRSFWLTILFFTVIVNLTMLRMSYLRLKELNADLMRSTWSGILILCFLISIISFWLIFQGIRNGSAFTAFVGRLDNFRFESLLWRMLGVVLFVAVLFLIPYVKFTFEIGWQVKKPV